MTCLSQPHQKLCVMHYDIGLTNCNPVAKPNDLSLGSLANGARLPGPSNMHLTPLLAQSIPSLELSNWVKRQKRELWGEGEPCIHTKLDTQGWWGLSKFDLRNCIHFDRYVVETNCFGFHIPPPSNAISIHTGNSGYLLPTT